jgi:hypothetical protein
MEDSFTSEQMVAFATFCRVNKVIIIGEHAIYLWKESIRKEHLKSFKASKSW